MEQPSSLQSIAAKPGTGEESSQGEPDGVPSPQNFESFYQERKAQKFPTGDNPENDAVLQKALRALNLSGGQVLMDFGCADGYFTQKLARAVPGVRAIGIDLVAHDSWRDYRSENVTFVSGELPTPLMPGSVDAIFCSQVLEHVPDPLGVATEFCRVLKPGGRVWLATPNSYDDTARIFHAHQRRVDEIEGHLCHFGARDIERLFGPLGFECTAIRYDTFVALWLYYRFVAYSPLKARLMPFVAPEIAVRAGMQAAEPHAQQASGLKLAARAVAFSLMRAARSFDDLFGASKYGQVIEVTLTKK